MDLNLNDMKTKLYSYYSKSLNNKKYIVFYIIFIGVILLSAMNLQNYQHPKMEILIFVIAIIIGIFIINYNSQHEQEIHKTAFLLIILTGICLCFLSPIGIISDESEHFSRAVLTSMGNFFPTYNLENQGFLTIELVKDIRTNLSHTIFNSNLGSLPINYTSIFFDCAFQQNPFYGYVIPAIGILIAELFNLSSIWPFWLGRIFNLIFYASCITVAIKKTPILKVPFFVMSCSPFILIQSASLSIDSFIFGISFILISYFLYLLKDKNIKIGKKEIFIFFALTVLLGLCKVTLFAFGFLIFIIPRNKFKTKNYHYIFIGMILLGLIAVIWSFYYAVPSYSNSWRLNYQTQNNINSSQQLHYMLNHISETLIMIFQLPNYLLEVFSHQFTFSYGDTTYYSNFISGIYPPFLGAILLLYPNKYKITKRERTGVFIICILIFVGTYLIQLLTWTPVGQLNFIEGIQFRYFLPLAALAPFCFGFNNNSCQNTKINNIIITLTMVFIMALLFITVVNWY